MALHRLRIDFDEDKGTLSITHWCSTKMGGHLVTSSVPIELEDGEEYMNTLKALIDSNREQVETLSRDNAIDHVAAVRGVDRRNRRGSKEYQVKTGGKMGASGTGEG